MSTMSRRGRLDRREFCGLAASGFVATTLIRPSLSSPPLKQAAQTGVRVSDARKGEGLFKYITRVRGHFDQTLYREVVGAANPFKEGDQILGVAAIDDASRQKARSLLTNTRAGQIAARPLFEDSLYARLQDDVDPAARRKVDDWTLGQLRAFLLERDEPEIRTVLDGLSSDLIGCLVKLMDDDDLIAVGRKLFHPLPGTQIGAAGYLGARIQPNSPTDNVDDIIWCLDRIMPANPAYLMALPTKNDPMLGYLTTGFQDHVRLRQRFGYRVNDRMWAFFQRLGVIDKKGDPTPHFGQPLWVWLQYRCAKGDTRPVEQIQREGQERMNEVRQRGVFLAEGFGKEPWDLTPELSREVHYLYVDSKKCIHAELTPEFLRSLSDPIFLRTTSADRTDYILHPQTGEMLDGRSQELVRSLRASHTAAFQIQVVVSDGLNAQAIMDDGHLAPYLASLWKQLEDKGYTVAPQFLVVHGGRVRAGYRIGELLFDGACDASARRGIVHLIGERPGSMHHTFSAYITALPTAIWSQPGRTDHNHTRVVSGIADTAFQPAAAAQTSVRILDEFWAS